MRCSGAGAVFDRQVLLHPIFKHALAFRKYMDDRV